MAGSKADDTIQNMHLQSGQMAARFLDLIYAAWRCAGLGRWAASNDPVLQRYGVGALARVAASGPAGFNAVADAGVLPHLIAALACGDAQVRCFAAGAIGALSLVPEPKKRACALACKYHLAGSLNA